MDVNFVAKMVVIWKPEIQLAFGENAEPRDADTRDENQSQLYGTLCFTFVANTF